MLAEPRRTELRRGLVPLDFLVRVGACWVIVAGLLLLLNWGAITAARLPDADDTMRLIQLRDWLGGQGWFDLTQHRVDAPGGGAAMAFSRIVDLPLALVIALLAPFVGSAAAEQAALVIVPLVTLGAAMVLAMRIAWRLLGNQEAVFTALIMALSVPVVFELAPLRIDHHGWQLVCAMAAMNGLMARSPANGGRVIGVSLAVWLTISIAALPLVAVMLAVLALRWLRERRERVWLVSTVQALALGSTVLFLATRGPGDWTTYCDGLSPVHLAMFGWAALIGTGLARIEPLPLAALIGGLALAAGGALAILLGVAPQCAPGGDTAVLDPLVRDNWFMRGAERLPLWHQPFSAALGYAITPLIGLYSALRLAQRAQHWLQRFWIDYALILATAIALAMLEARGAALACLLAAPPLAWQVHRWLRAIRTIERPAMRAGALLVVACALLPTLPLALAALVSPTQAQVARAAAGGGAGGGGVQADCRIAASAPILQRLPAGEIYAPLDMAPHLLLVSHHRVIATGHERGGGPARMVIATALGSSAAARAALAGRGAHYVALCPGHAEARLYASAAPDGFVADLMAGRVPDWLEPVKTAPGTSLQLWRITRQENRAPAR